MRRPATALLLASFVALGGGGCSSSDESTVIRTTTVPATGAASIAYDYFGSAELAQGTTLDTGIRVASSEDVTVVQTPAGVTATITDGLEGATRLKLEIADDAPIGAQTITFDIAGEPEPVDWTIEIIPG